MIPFRLYAIGGLVLAVLIGGGIIARNIYKSGQEQVRVEQERASEMLRKEAERVKSNTLTLPDADVDERLRRDARPEP